MNAVQTTVIDENITTSDKYLRLMFQDQLFENQSPQEIFTYAIIDGACNSKIKEMLDYYSPEFSSLYDDQTTEEADFACPWIVRLSEDSGFTHWFVDNVDLSNSACIFRSRISNLLNLRDYYAPYAAIDLEQKSREDPSRAYFAFYDARVFLTYLESMNEEERSDFFYPISIWYFVNKVTSELEQVTFLTGKSWHEKVDLNQHLLIPSSYQVFSDQDIMSKHISPLLTQRQLQVINGYHDRTFCTRVVESIHTHYPGKIPSFTAVDDALRFQQQAIKLELQTESEQATYILGASLFGSTFITNIELRKYLQEKDYSSIRPAEYMQQLVDDLVEEVSE